jgi:hypothetical protein
LDSSSQKGKEVSMETLVDSVLLGWIVLKGEEGVNWEAPETDDDWWQLYLWTRRN